MGETTMIDLTTIWVRRPAPQPVPAKWLTLLSAGLLLAMTLAGINIALVLLQTGEASASPVSSVVAAHALIAGDLNPGGPQPVMFALLLAQALVMVATTLVLWKQAARSITIGRRFYS